MSIRATGHNGNASLTQLSKCYIIVPGAGTININVLPDISDQKSAAYNDEPIMGRAFPLKTYSHSENRAISFTIHLIAAKQSDINQNMQYLRYLESAIYPRETGGAPFVPPPVCKIKCGKLLSDDELCVVLRSYTVKFSTDAVWEETTYFPYNFDIDTSWEVVYRSSNLPGQDRIISSGG